MYHLIQILQKLDYSAIQTLLFVVNRMVEREERQMRREGWTEEEIKAVRLEAYQEVDAFIEEFEVNEES